MKVLRLTDEQYGILIEVLNAYKEMLFMLNKLPIHKAKKIKGKQFQVAVDDFKNIIERCIENED